MTTLLITTPGELEAIVERAVRRVLGDAPSPAAGVELTSEQVAAELGVAEKTVRRMARDGRLRGQRRGKQWRFTREAITAYREPRTGIRERVQADLQHAVAARESKGRGP